MSFSFENFHIAAFPPTKNNGWRVRNEIYTELLESKKDVILCECLTPHSGEDVDILLYKFMDGRLVANGDRFYHNNVPYSTGRQGVVYRCRRDAEIVNNECRDWYEVDVIQN